MPVIPAVVAVLVSCGVTYFVTPLGVRLAHRFGVLDRPRGHKSHREPVPYLGGVAIIIGFLVATGALRVLVDVTSETVLGDFSTGILLALGLGTLGLVDDVRPLPRVIRLGAQIALAFGAWEAGFRAEPTDSENLNLLLTLLWIVGITNALNLLDNMDGLSAGLTGVGALSFAAMSVVENLGIVAIVAGAVAGSAFGFLGHNRHPARVFMGDSGSLFLGFMLALIGIEMRFDNLVEVTFLVPVVVLGLPIFDTTLVVLSRLRRGRSPFLGGRDHVSHRLVQMGLPVRFSVGLLYWTALCLGWLGLVISHSTAQVAWMLLGFVFALALFFAFFLWRVPVHDAELEEPASHADAETIDQLPPPQEPSRAETGT